jgi:hypothetical protein
MNEGYRWKKKLFSEQGRAAEAYAMVTLFETGCFSGAIRLKDSTTISPHGISGCRPLSVSTLSNSELR